MRGWTAGGAVITGATLAAMVVACGGDSGGNDPPPDEDPPVIQKTATSNGDGQTGTVGERLQSPLQVVITRNSEPQAGVVVTWDTPDGGLVAPPTSSSDADGIAGGLWDLGPDPGPQTATATLAGAQGSPVTFTATAEEGATPPPPPPSATILVLGPSGTNRFEPDEVTIQTGQTVRWSWPVGSLSHNVAPDDDEPTLSGPLANGPEEYSFTFTTPGTYNFFCANHGGPGGIGMSGTVIVEP